MIVRPPRSNAGMYPVAPSKRSPSSKARTIAQAARAETLQGLDGDMLTPLASGRNAVTPLGYALREIAARHIVRSDMTKRFQLISALVGVALSTAAFANVTVSPQQSAAGGREKYELRVPNERKSATITVEIRFPAGLRVTAVEQKPGWHAEALRDSSGNLAGVRWIGNLPPEQFTEFGLLGVNPASGRELAFTVVQAFADGTKVEWSGGAGSRAPAARVTLKPR